LGVPDTDGDGIKDADEESGMLGFVTDPLKPDTDDDGISDRDEQTGAFGAATDPANPDSDGDGFSDYQELVLYHSDPNNRASTPMSGLSVPFFEMAPPIGLMVPPDVGVGPTPATGHLRRRVGQRQESANDLTQQSPYVKIGQPFPGD
jgi:hypothetical protein